MKRVSFLILFLAISASFMAQYSIKDKVFKAISKSDIALFNSEVSRLESIEDNLDSVYLMESIYNHKGEKVYESFNIVEDAIRRGSLEMVKALFEIKHKFPSFKTDVEGMYPFLIFKNEMDKFKFILDQDVDINAQCKVCFEQSPLLIAVNYENYPLALELLDRGADPSFKNNDGYSVLMAVTVGDTFSVDLFDRLVYEEKVNINQTDKKGWSALSYGLYHSNIEASKKLLAAGAALVETDQANLIASGSVQLFRQFKDKNWLELNINSWRFYDDEDDIEYSLLDYAMLSENPKMVKILIVDYNADINLFEDIYDNALYEAIDSHSEKMVNIILEYGDTKNVNKYFLKRAKKRKFSSDTLEKIEKLIGE